MLYNGKAKYGGMDVCEAKRLKQLGDANAKLNKLLAEQMLDAAALCELPSKKGWGPPSRAKASRIFGPRWACRNGGPARSSALTARWSVTAHAGRQTGSFGRNCAISPMREAFRISSAVRPVAAGGRALGHQPHLPALSRRRPHGAQATGSEARRGVADADPSRNASRRLAGRWISSTTSLSAAGGSSS